MLYNLFLKKNVFASEKGRGEKKREYEDWAKFIFWESNLKLFLDGLWHGVMWIVVT